MLFLICCVWVFLGILGCVLIRRDFVRLDFAWLNKDKVLWLVVGVLLGPILTITGLILLFCDLVHVVHERAPEWFDRPSRW